MENSKDEAPRRPDGKIAKPEDFNRQDSMLLAIVIHDLAAVDEPRDVHWIIQSVLGPGAPSLAKGLFGASLGASVGGMIGAIIGWTALNSGHREVNRILRVIPSGVQTGLLAVSGSKELPLLAATDAGRGWSEERYSQMDGHRR